MVSGRRADREDKQLSEFEVSEVCQHTMPQNDEEVRVFHKDSGNGSECKRASVVTVAHRWAGQWAGTPNVPTDCDKFIIRSKILRPIALPGCSSDLS